jgi:hypothetical protein
MPPQSRAFFYSRVFFFKFRKSKRHKKGKKIHNYNQGNQRAPQHTLAGRNQISFSPGAPIQISKSEIKPFQKRGRPHSSHPAQLLSLFKTYPKPSSSSQHVTKTPTHHNLLPLSLTDGPACPLVLPVCRTQEEMAGPARSETTPKILKPAVTQRFNPARAGRPSLAATGVHPSDRPIFFSFNNTRPIPLSHRRILSLPSSPNLQLPNPSSRAGAGDVSSRARVRAGDLLSVAVCLELAGERGRRARGRGWRRGGSRRARGRATAGGWWRRGSGPGRRRPSAASGSSSGGRSAPAATAPSP